MEFFGEWVVLDNDYYEIPKGFYVKSLKIDIYDMDYKKYYLIFEIEGKQYFYRIWDLLALCKIFDISYFDNGSQCIIPLDMINNKLQCQKFLLKTFYFNNNSFFVKCAPLKKGNKMILDLGESPGSNKSMFMGTIIYIDLRDRFDKPKIKKKIYSINNRHFFYSDLVPYSKVKNNIHNYIKGHDVMSVFDTSEAFQLQDFEIKRPNLKEYMEVSWFQVAYIQPTK